MYIAIVLFDNIPQNNAFPNKRGTVLKTFGGAVSWSADVKCT